MPSNATARRRSDNLRHFNTGSLVISLPMLETTDSEDPDHHGETDSPKPPPAEAARQRGVEPGDASRSEVAIYAFGNVEGALSEQVPNLLQNILIVAAHINPLLLGRVSGGKRTGKRPMTPRPNRPSPNHRPAGEGGEDCTECSPPGRDERERASQRGTTNGHTASSFVVPHSCGAFLRQRRSRMNGTGTPFLRSKNHQKLIRVPFHGSHP